MLDVTRADAKARLDELIDRAAAGEDVRIVDQGRPVVQLTAVTTPPRRRVDLARLRALTAAMPRQNDGAAAMIRKMRDRERC